MITAPRCAMCGDPFQGVYDVLAHQVTHSREFMEVWEATVGPVAPARQRSGVSPVHDADRTDHRE